MTEDEIRSLFREMRDEPVPPDSRVRVRAAVAAGIQTSSWMASLRTHWKAAVAILAPACLVLAAVLVSVPKPVAEPRPPAPPPVQETVPEAPPEVAPLPVKQVVRRAGPRQPSAPAVREHEEEVVAGTVIRIETPDPNVVILLVGG